MVIPGHIYAVFDGATDPFGTVVNGESVGRIAARTVAEFFSGIALDPKLSALSGPDLIQQAADRLGAVNARLGLKRPASTTLAVVIEEAAAFRILILGDSGVRVNGEAPYVHNKLVDEVSTAARVAAFRLLRTRFDGDAVEKNARQVVFLGFQQACEDGLLSRAEAERVVDAVCRDARFSALSDHVRFFLMGGIQTQSTHTNNAVSPLGYSGMNGSPPMLREMIETRLPKAGVRTIELFTDGYVSVPAGTGVAAWEEEFARVERTDFHKIGAHPGVKGSTAEEYSDDRTVIALAFGDVP
ncbi:MAG: hypothetical protein LCH61_13990 [Proteobacteria bacterium]|nr:hypothetical protein [Pseudomonadota bacterium]